MDSVCQNPKKSKGIHIQAVSNTKSHKYKKFQIQIVSQKNQIQIVCNVWLALYLVCHVPKNLQRDSTTNSLMGQK